MLKKKEKEMNTPGKANNGGIVWTEEDKELLWELYTKYEDKRIAVEELVQLKPYRQINSSTTMLSRLIRDKELEEQNSEEEKEQQQEPVVLQGTKYSTWSLDDKMLVLELYSKYNFDKTKTIASFLKKQPHRKEASIRATLDRLIKEQEIHKQVKKEESSSNYQSTSTASQLSKLTPHEASDEKTLLQWIQEGAMLPPKIYTLLLTALQSKQVYISNNELCLTNQSDKMKDAFEYLVTTPLDLQQLKLLIQILPQ